MAKNRQPSVVADFLAAAFAPALVMGMIYCLISFLILVFYREGFQVRVNYLFALYIFASVLIARIAIDSGRAYALGYTIALGASTLFVISRFVVFQGPLASLSPFINAGLLALVGYLADRIVFDCTLIESDRDTSGEGLLQSLGLVRSDLSKGPVGKTKRRRRHNPGVSILYFALLAIPLYGVGQLFLPSEATGVRERAFYLLFGYFACSFSLLVTTSFLGLRRYLSQRGVEIPFEFAATWLGMGLLGTLMFLGLCMLLPLPGREYGLFDLPFDVQSSQGLTASRYGWGGEGVGDGDGGTPTAPHPSPGSPSNVGSTGSESTSGSKATNGTTTGQSGGSSGANGDSPQGGKTPTSNPQSHSERSGGENSNSSGQGSEGQRGGDNGASTTVTGKKQSDSLGSNTTTPSNRANQSNLANSNPSTPTSANSGKNGEQGQPNRFGNRESGSQSNSNSKSTSSNNVAANNDSGQQSEGMNKPENNSDSASQNSSGQASGYPNSQPNNNSTNPSDPKANSQNSSRQISNSPSRGSQGKPGQSTSEQPTPEQSDSSQGDRAQSSSPSDSSDSNPTSQANRGQDQSTRQQNDSRNDPSQDVQQQNPQQSDSQAPESPNRSQQNESQPPNSQQSDSQESESPKPIEPSQPWFNFELGSWLGPILKWFTVAALLGFFVYYAITHRSEITAWLAGIRAWWSMLWGLEEDQATEAGGELVSQKRKQSASFASFSNPFRSRESKKDSGELVRYTYAAVEAWGAERGVIRAEGQTAEEYLRRLSGALPKCQEELTSLANAYTRLAYAGRRAILVDLQSLQKLWMAMEHIPATPSTNSAV